MQFISTFRSRIQNASHAIFLMISIMEKEAFARIGQAKRSTSQASRHLQVSGARWTRLIVRHLFFVKTRFGEIAVSPEKIPTNTLSDRL